MQNEAPVCNTDNQSPQPDMVPEVVADFFEATERFIADDNRSKVAKIGVAVMETVVASSRSNQEYLAGLALRIIQR